MSEHAARVRVGSVEWERAGGPPLSLWERLVLLGHAGTVMATHFSQRLLWRLRRKGLLPARVPRKVDLSAWEIPDSRAARDAERFLAEVCSPEVVNHS